MSEGNKNIKQYSAADIQKYVQGKLSAQEMHAIEKAAMDDPLLADAIEGMQNNFRDEKSFNDNVEDLKTRLTIRVEEKNKIIPFYTNRFWLRVVASVVLLLGATALTYNFFITDSLSKQNIVAAKQEEAVADSNIEQKKPAPISVLQDSVDKSGSNSSVKIPEKNISHTNKEGHNIVFDKKTAEKKQFNYSIIQHDSVKYNVPHLVKPVMDDNKIADVPQTALQGKVAGVNIKRKSVPKYYFKGKVVDENKQPVIGASVMLRNKKTGIRTNSDGDFNIETNSKDSSLNVVVNSIGYNKISATLKNNDTSQNVIQLQPSSLALNEVVVTALGVASESKDADDEVIYNPKPKKEKDTSAKAIPAMGLVQYNNYINNNKKIITADSTIKGKEIISFVINKKGGISDFKIVQSLSPMHDAEAIRLIKNGPAWKLLKGKKARITFAIEFL